MRNFIVLAGLALLTACASPRDDPFKPSIILILADDLGTVDVHCYNPASEIPTPAMDRIASRGMQQQ